MSNCRCSDIQDTENKIDQLERACGIASGYGFQKDNRDNMLVRCSLFVRNATQSNKVSIYHSAFESLGNEMDQASSSISGKINDKLGELGRNLIMMRQEDEDYHEQERIKEEQAAKEAAERAAAERAAEKAARVALVAGERGINKRVQII